MIPFLRRSVLFFVSLAMLSAGPSWAASVEAPWEKLLRSHPRILARQEDFAALKARCVSDPLAKNWRQHLDREAEKLLTAAPSRYEIPDGKRLLAVSRRVLERVSLLGMEWRLTGDARWPKRAWAELDAAARFKDWNPKHFLDTAEMTAAFAIGYDWMHDVWTAEQRTGLRKAITSLGLEEGRKCYEKGGWWVSAVHNWNQVCNGGMLMGALALAEDAPDLARTITAGALASIPRALAEYAPDGAYREGVGYWSYGTGYNVLLIAALRSAFGTELGLADAPGFAETGWFPIHCTGPSGLTFNFADCGEGGIGRNWALPWLGRRFRQPAFLAAATAESRPDALLFLWMPTAPTGEWSRIPTAKYFRDAEVAAFRTRWADPQATWVAFKAGSPRFNHAQMDAGTFVFEMSGKRWAVDPGKDNYNLPGYFDKSGRWKFYRNRAEGNNTLTLAPDGGPDQEINPVSRITKFSGDPHNQFAIADLTPSYGKRAARVRRGIRIFPSGGILIQDEIESPRGGGWWFMHTRARITPSAHGRSAVFDDKGVKMQANLSGGAGGERFQVMEAAPLPGSPKVEGQEDNRNLRKLAIALAADKSVRLGVFFSPAGQPIQPGALTLQPLDNW